MGNGLEDTGVVMICDHWPSIDLDFERLGKALYTTVVRLYTDMKILEKSSTSACILLDISN